MGRHRNGGVGGGRPNLDGNARRLQVIARQPAREWRGALRLSRRRGGGREQQRDVGKQRRQAERARDGKGQLAALVLE